MTKSAIGGPLLGLQGEGGGFGAVQVSRTEATRVQKYTGILDALEKMGYQAGADLKEALKSAGYNPQQPVVGQTKAVEVTHLAYGLPNGKVVGIGEITKHGDAKLYVADEKGLGMKSTSIDGPTTALIHQMQPGRQGDARLGVRIFDGEQADAGQSNPTYLQAPPTNNNPVLSTFEVKSIDDGIATVHMTAFTTEQNFQSQNRNQTPWNFQGNVRTPINQGQEIFVEGPIAGWIGG